ncbi:unnamed protein product [Paramecium pentaurelia]|uniref:G domain-containing protein n=1 Tax=Paramecium pentaurelia TaxID=43138 RepID=A0A8S1WZE3_9CILI|nr:unnamed protein product [Paramecium pentaurelia]
MQQIQNNETEDQDFLKYISQQILSIELNIIPCTIQKQQSIDKIVLFLGFQHNEFDQFYSHFIDNKCLQQNEFFKIVKIKKDKHSSYLINSPYSLNRCSQEDEKIKLFSSKINLELIFLNFKICEIHVVINYQNLLGNSEEEKLKNIIDYKFLNFGRILLKNEKISLINCYGNNQFSYTYLIALKSQNHLNFIEIEQQKILRNIFKKNEFLYFQILKHPIQFNYGEMSSEMMKDQEQLFEFVLNKIEQFQIQLLNLQQIPKLKDYHELSQSLGNYLKQLNEILSLYKKPKFSFVWKIVYKINHLNMNIGSSINIQLKNLNQQLLQQFLKMKRCTFEDLFIKMQLLETNHLKQIDEFLRKYNQYQYDDVLLVSLQNFAINVDFWNSYFKDFFESKLSQLNMISKNLQPQPQQDFEKGVFFFGKSKAGKSTILNLIQNPEILTIKKVLSDYCYVVKDGQQSQFNIGDGFMSETQMIQGTKIDDVWYFDCPGFDDNISEYTRIAHRINLQNYLRKTKKVIGFLVIDGSIKNAEVIQDTINPLYELIQDKNQLLIEHHKWLSLILVKINKSTRIACINNWDQAFKQLLNGQYSIYKQMYENDNQCVEFYKAKKKYLQDNQKFEAQKNNMKVKINNIINSQLQNYDFQLNFDLILDETLAQLIGDGVSILIIKVQNIVKILTNLLNDYILENKSEISQKLDQIQKLQDILKQDIIQSNLEEFLFSLLSWCQDLMQFDNLFSFLHQLIIDVHSYLKMLLYAKNNLIAPLQINTEIIRENMKKIIEIINKIKELSNKADPIRQIALSDHIGQIVLSIHTLGTFFKDELMLAFLITLTSLPQLQKKLLKIMYQKYLEEKERNERI